VTNRKALPCSRRAQPDSQRSPAGVAAGIGAGVLGDQFLGVPEVDLGDVRGHGWQGNPEPGDGVAGSGGSRARRTLSRTGISSPAVSRRKMDSIAASFGPVLAR
jgi:hypothetical protein